MHYLQFLMQRSLSAGKNVSATSLLALGLLLTPAAKALVILQYHHISTQTPSATSISPARFQEHLLAIENSGYAVLDLATVTRLLRSAEPLPEDAVLITFDDSYSAVYEVAFPLLQQRGWPFVVFANTEPVDQRLQGFMSWKQLREMASHGATIGNHTVSHPHMVRHRDGENAAAWQRRMRAEILGAERRIKAEIGHSHRVLAYPYGEYSAELTALLQELDFLGMGQHSGAATPAQALALPRFAFGGDYGQPEDFALKLGALPLPLAEMQIETEQGAILPDGILPLDVSQPRVVLTLSDPLPLEKLQCYVSLQGRAERRQAIAPSARFQAAAPLLLGRSRYNCTAPSAQPGRFYWYSVPFVRRDNDGSWLAEP